MGTQLLLFDVMIAVVVVVGLFLAVVRVAGGVFGETTIKLLRLLVATSSKSVLAAWQASSLSKYLVGDVSSTSWPALGDAQGVDGVLGTFNELGDANC